MITVLFCGDFAPCGGYEPIILRKQEAIYGDALSIINSADVSFVNLECSLTLHNKPINKSGPTLKADPACAEALKCFDLVGLANNHILDCSWKGLEDTINACESRNIAITGAGRNISEAKRHFVTEVKGMRIAIIALAEREFNETSSDRASVALIDPIDNYQQITQAKKNADIVILTLHAGTEYFRYPRPGLRKLCRHYIDLGVEAVVCHHPHVPGAYEYYKGKPILYSLGNFIFSSTNPPKDWEYGYMAGLGLDVNKKRLVKLDLIPYKQSVALEGITLLQGEEKHMFLRRIDEMKVRLDDENLWLNEWNAHIAKVSDNYILRQYSPFWFRGIGILTRILPLARILMRNKNRLDKLNMLRCQTHHEVLIAAMERALRHDLENK